MTLSEQLHSLINSTGSISNGPFLQSSKNFQHGPALKDLIPDVLCQGFYNLQTDEIDPKKMVLYKHQEEAILRIVREDRNVVISTGTGSGKTKSFLIPILNYLLTQQENGELGPGVRAMLIYPMNALVNDQTRLLRKILDGQSITFGSFTGETKESQKDAEDLYCKKGIRVQSNELISREKMRESPPNILITNYAMLEHIIIKPENNRIIFGEPGKNDWKYVVLDEAHVYTGAKGSEVSLLMRRLRAVLQRDELRFILASATLGSDTEQESVVKFANELCGCEKVRFEKDDIIHAHMLDIYPNGSDDIPIDFYREISKLEDKSKDPDHFEYLCRGYISKQGFDASLGFRSSLFDILSKDRRLYRLLEYLRDEPQNVDDVAEHMGLSRDDLFVVVKVLSMAYKDGLKLFDSKYHLFIRSLDSLYITLKPDYHLSLSPSKFHTSKTDGRDYKCFNICTCVNCNGLYIIGTFNGAYFSQASSSSSEPQRVSSFAVLGDQEFPDPNSPNNYVLCSICGRVGDPSVPCPDHGPMFSNRIYMVKEEGDKVCDCFFCNQRDTRRGLLRHFYLGHEAATSVIATSLYDELCNVSGGDCRFLTFSDSRQNAAYFATYMDNTHRNLLMHRIMYDVVEDEYDVLRGKGLALDKFRMRLEGEIRRHFGDEFDSKAESWITVLEDCAKHNSNRSLENKGILFYEVNEIPSELVDDYGFTAEDAYQFFNVLIKYVRDKTSILIEDSAANALSSRIYYKGDLLPITINGDGVSAKFLTERVRKFIAYFIGNDRVDDFVKKLFWSEYFERDSHIGFRLDPKKLVVRSKDTRYVCTKCKKTFPFSCRGRCINCNESSLEEVPNTSDPDDSYLYLYKNMALRRLRIKEHTAQLISSKAEEYQSQFIDKTLDALSCSTTFEMGVDIGELNTVFLRNMPPTPSNYIQRAGRAGRSSTSSSYTVTFCKNSPHDFYYFNHPKDMIMGNVPVPNIKPDNPKIAIRHIFATAMAYYWREVYPIRGSVRTVDALMDTMDDFTSYLRSNPEDLKKFLMEFVPTIIQEYKGTEESGVDPKDPTLIDIGLSTSAWMRNLIDSNVGRLSVASQEYHEDMKQLDDSTLSQKTIDAVRNQINKETALDFLSRKNIIPKYGFPVDLVELRTANRTATEELNLSRDLTLAISEYAPGSQIIANGSLITSRYVKHVPTRDLPRYYYRTCLNCGTVSIVFDTAMTKEESEAKLNVCRSCSTPLSGKIKNFIIPRFGFLYDKDEIRNVVNSKPVRTYSGEIFYRSRDDLSSTEFTVGNECILVSYSPNDELVAINSTPELFICNKCGYGVVGTTPSKHQTPYGAECDGKIKPQALGHVFRTDVVILDFASFHDSGMNLDAALSVLYALIEGMSNEFSIDRRDISGCLYTDGHNFRFVFFDMTPGGAGYVKILKENSGDNIRRTIQKGLEIVNSCNCGGAGGNTVCFSCLLNYYNQRYQDKMTRRAAIDWLSSLEIDS